MSGTSDHRWEGEMSGDAVSSAGHQHRRAWLRAAACCVLILARQPASAIAQQVSPLPPGTASISGRVTADDTGKPLRGATVQIVIYENISARFPQVTTDAQGTFEFTGLPAGHFRLAA